MISEVMKLLRRDLDILLKGMCTLASVILFYRLIEGSMTDSAVWNTFSSIFSAVGTMLAVIVSLWFATKEARRRKVEEERLYAEQVSGWLVSELDPVMGDSFPVYRAKLSNSSNLPVYTVIVKVAMFQSGEASPLERGLHSVNLFSQCHQEFLNLKLNIQDMG